MMARVSFFSVLLTAVLLCNLSCCFGSGTESRLFLDIAGDNNGTEAAVATTEDYALQVNSTRAKFSRALFHNEESNELDSLDSIARSLTGVVGRNDNSGLALARLGDMLGLKGLTHIHIIKGVLLLLAFAIPFLITVVPRLESKLFDFVEHNAFADMTSHLARNVYNSEHCIQRLSCEVGRASHANFLDRFVTKMIHQIGQYMPSFLRPLASAYLDRTFCKKYTCGLMDRFIFGQPQFVPPPPPHPPPHHNNYH